MFMGLFSKKKFGSAPVSNKTVDKAKTINPDDIWNMPIKRNGVETVTLKESKYGEPVTEAVASVPEVKPEVVKEKMAQLEKELAEKKDIPVKSYHDYDVNPVKADETAAAQVAFEKEYSVSHEKFLKTHVQDISYASEDGLNEKLNDMIKRHDEKTLEMQNTDFGFNSVEKEEISRRMQDLTYAKKDEDYPEYKDIKEISADEESVEKLGTIDHSEDQDKIKCISAEDINEKLEKFNSQYGEKKGSV